MSRKADGCVTTRRMRWRRVVAALAILAAGAWPACAQDGWPPAPPISNAEAVESGQLPMSIQASWVDGRWKTAFHFKPDAAAKSVGLAGTFNGWNPAATPLSGPDGEGSWTGECGLANG